MRIFPARSGAASASPFVGRASGAGDAPLPDAAAEAEGRRVVLLAGEPGAGKSRLVREFAGEAAGRGRARPLRRLRRRRARRPTGRSSRRSTSSSRVTDADELRAALGAGGGELTRLLPDLPTRVGELPAPVDADPDTERHRLHTAVTDLLASVSRRRPMLLVLEDGHWADAPTLLLLRHLARSAWSAPAAAAGDLPRHRGRRCRASSSETLADLRRSDDVVRMRLAALSGAEVADLVSRARGGPRARPPSCSELASAIHDLTGGNAFLVCELWRALVETGIVEVAAGRSAVTAAAAASSARPRACARSSASGSRAWTRGRPTCSSSPRSPARSSSWSRSAAPPASPSPSCSPPSRRRWAAA